MKGICLYLSLLSPIFLHAQIFSPISNHSNNGVLNILSNPANLRTDSSFTWDANLFSLSAWGGGTNASLSVKQLTGVNNNLLRENILGISGVSTGSGIIDITGPTIAFKLGKKSSLAIGTRVRMFSNFWNVDGRLVSEIGEDIKEPQPYPYMISSAKDMMLNAAMFSDISLSYAKEMYKNGPHSIKAGITLKYLTAMSHASIDVQGLQGKVGAVTSNGVPYITAATGQITTRSSGDLFTDIKLGSFTSALIGNGSIGGDIGLVYEYKPADLKKGKTDYRFKVGISITDIGKIAYHPDSLYSRSYNVHIPTTDALYFNNNFQNSSFAHTTEVYDKYPKFFTPTATQSSKYNIGLPTTLKLFIDANLGNGLFVSADINAGLQKKESVTAMYVYNGIAIAPRYEIGDFSISLPIVYQSFTHASMGFGINVGPFYMGSGSLISGLVGKTKQLDGFIGLRIDPDKKKTVKTTSSNVFDLSKKEDKKSVIQRPVNKEQAKFTALTKLIDGELLAETILTTSNTVPFWMRSNQYGSIPLDGASVSVVASGTKHYDALRNAKLLDWGAGFDLRLNGGESAEAILVEAYAKARIGIFEIKAGRSKQVTGLVDSSGLSSGAFSMSGNALGIPKIQLAVNEYHALPFWNKFVALKGSMAFGWLGTNLLQKDTVNIIGPYGRRLGFNTPETYFLQQEIYARFGKPDAKLHFFAGINHNVMYGDEHKIFNNFDLSRWKTFLYAFRGTTWDKIRTKIGNHLGSVDLGLSYQLKNQNLFFYRQNFYDVGALGKLANLADGLNGISIENKKKNTGNFFWKKFLVELFYSKDQAGDSNSIVTSSGAENYYNNYLYLNGWSYKGVGIGNPFITTKTVARKGLPSTNDLFINNRVAALHIGAMVRVKTLDLVGKFSWSKNYGTYNTSPSNPRSVGPPYFGEVNQFSGYLEANKQLKNGYRIGGVFALDAGKLLYNSTGFVLKVSKSFSK